MKKAVVLVSGGIDSATMLALAKSQGYEVYALSINYNQTHKLELEYAKKITSSMKVINHKIIDIDFRQLGGSALTDESIQVPKYKDGVDLPTNVPVTYVPARNTIFLSFALAYAEIINSKDIFIAVHAQDHANYPDCRPEFIEAYEQLANVATSMTSSVNNISIHAPFVSKSKSDIIKTGVSLGVDYSNTVSCYQPLDNGYSCGSCLSCNVRLKAFADNNITDPINYIS